MQCPRRRRILFGGKDVSQRVRACPSPLRSTPRPRRFASSLGEIALLLDDFEQHSFVHRSSAFSAQLFRRSVMLPKRDRGFSFVARQKRIQLDGDDFYIDLLFYNRKLKRLVVVELKQGSFQPEYKGQMELYLPLGIILCAGRNTEQIELLELGTAGIHVAEYLTVLPPPEVLREKLHKAIETARARIEAREDDEDADG